MGSNELGSVEDPFYFSPKYPNSIQDVLLEMDQEKPSNFYNEILTPTTTKKPPKKKKVVYKVVTQKPNHHHQGTTKKTIYKLVTPKTTTERAKVEHTTQKPPANIIYHTRKPFVDDDAKYDHTRPVPPFSTSPSI